jgi:hypothetical protein
VVRRDGTSPAPRLVLRRSPWSERLRRS